MPTDNPKLDELKKARQSRAVAEDRYQHALARWLETQNLLEIALRKEPTQEVIDSLREDSSSQQQRTGQAQVEFAEASELVDNLRAELLPEPPAFPDLPGQLSSDCPIVFFPIRLETKYGGPHGAELHIRIYPDDLHIDTHETRLTDAEVELGRRFWTQAWGPEGNEAGAWNELASRVRAPRAAWIVKIMEPTNTAKQKIAGTNPDFKVAHRRAATWTRAPRAAMLPDRWFARAKMKSGAIRTGFGKLIPDLLAAGPAPQFGVEKPEDPAVLENPLNLLDDEMKWLVDFTEALEVGMAISLELPLMESTEIERLIVFGVKTSKDAESTAEDLGALFDAHHYTNSLSFIPRGTPTNNTSNAPSGYDSMDLGSERSFAVERGAALFTPGSKANGDLAATALGVTPETFSHVARADGNEESASQSLNAALWGATWGYFLTRQLNGAVKHEQLARVRRHFIDFVRGGGPFPSFRIGKQPYGLLPVTYLDGWLPAAGDEHDVGSDGAGALQRVRESCRWALKRGTTRVNSDDADGSLMEVLRQSPTSSAFDVRHVIGPQILHNYVIFSGNLLTREWWQAQQVLARLRFRIEGVPDFTLQSVSVELPYLNPIKTELVQFPPLAAGSQLSPNYIEPLINATISQLRLENLFAGNDFPVESRPLLYRMLRHSLLIDYVDASRRIRLKAGVMPAWVEPESEHFNMYDAPPMPTDWYPTPTVWDGLVSRIESVTGEKTLSEFLENTDNDEFPDLQHPDLKDLIETRNALRWLRDLTVRNKPNPLLPETLELLTREALDTCSYRLDAWVTSVATQRLYTQRLDKSGDSKPPATYVGGYGWVENLKPKNGSVESEGFIHAPSQAQATTAGILASAYLSHRNQPDQVDPFVIDMSSDRVRLARQLINGVRQGQPLGALVGYRIERKLQDESLPHYIAGFRSIAPLAGASPTSNVPNESVAANNVVDGIRILQMRKPGNSDHDKFWALVSNSDVQAIENLFNSIESDVDALGDVMMAEKVYQATRGNFSRAGYSAEDIARGQPLSQPEVIDTPRTGTAVGHRVMFFWENDVAQSALWPKVPHDDAEKDLQIRAKVEPRLDALAEQLLPNPAKVICRAQFLNPGTGEPLQHDGQEISTEVTLRSLDLSALDAVYISSSSTAAERGELEQRVEYAALKSRPAEVPADVKVRLDYTRNPDWAAEILSFRQFHLIAATVRRLFAISRSLTPGDLFAATEHVDPETSSIDTEDFAGRANIVAAALREMPALLKDVIGKEATIALDDIRKVLLRCTYLGIKAAVPVATTDAFPDARPRLILQAQSVLNDVQAAIRRLDEAESQPSSPLERDLRRIRSVLGSDFQVLPRVTSIDTAELNTAFGASTELQGGNAAEAGTWLGRLALVREPLKVLGDVLRNTEVLMNRAWPTTVGQLPYQPGDRWTALKLEKPVEPGIPSPEVPEGRVSIVACGTVKLEASQPIDAIVVDEWTELVPKERETTAVAFHFDHPGATAPQAILLGVAPDVSVPWNLDIIEAILLETFDLCKLRTLNHKALVEMNHYLPALYFALNAEGDTVTTNFGA
jgi:hypothetical protein